MINPTTGLDDKLNTGIVNPPSNGPIASIPEIPKVEPVTTTKTPTGISGNVYTGSDADKSGAQGFFNSYFKDVNQAKSQFDEFSQTGTFSKGLEGEYAKYKQGLGSTTPNTSGIFDPGSNGPMPTITEPTKVETPEGTGSTTETTVSPTIPEGTETPKVGSGINPDINGIVDTMFPKGTYSDDERAGVAELLKSKNAKEIADIMAQNAKGDYTKSQELLNAVRTTRDFGINANRTKVLNDQRVADLTQQYDNAITSQKQKMEADANNMSIIQGTAGRLKSRNMQNAITQMMDNSRTIYNQLVSNKDRDIARLGEDLKYAQTMASNEYNDKISAEMQEMLKGIQTLDKTGSLATAQGLVQARSFIDGVINNNMQHQADYYGKLSYISQRFDQYNKENLANSTVDDKVTSTMNDGYLYNAQGLRVKDESGLALKVTGSTSGTLLTKEPITMADGSKAFIYQNLDGTTRVAKIEGTKVPEVNPELLQSLQKGVMNGNITPDMIKMMNLPNEVVQSLIANMPAKKEEPMTKYQTAQLALEQKKFELQKSQNGKLTPAQQKDYDLAVDKLNFEKKKYNMENGIIEDVDTSKTIQYADSKEIGTKGGQCGAFVNKDPAAIENGIHFGDDYKTEKANLINSDQGQVGAYAVFQAGGSPELKKYGHVGIITGESEDGKSWIIKDSNWSTNPNDETVREHPVLKSQIEANGGYVIPGLNKETTPTLSSLAQATFDGNHVLGNSKQDEKVKKELADKGVYDLGEGNEVFFKAKPMEKTDISALIGAKETVEKVKEIYDKLKENGLNPVGPIDSVIKNIQNYVGISDTDYNDLKNLTTKDLNAYIQKMTGASMGVDEAKRLKTVIPTIDSTQGVFESNLENFINEANINIERTLGTYGFSDIEKAKKKLGIKTTVGKKVIKTSDGQEYDRDQVKSSLEG